MHICKYFITLLVLVASCTFAKPSSQVLITSLPPEIGDFQIGPVMSYGKPELGVSRGYKNYDDVTISVYVYDQNIDYVPDGTESSPIQYAFNQAQQDIETMQSMGHYTDVRQLSTQPVVMHVGKKGTIRLLSAKFEYKVIQKSTEDENAQNLMAVRSTLFVTGLKGHIIKLRITQRLPSRASVDEINNVVAAVLKRFSLVD